MDSIGKEKEMSSPKSITCEIITVGEELLLRETVIPWIRDRYHLEDQVILYKVLKVVGIAESKVDSVIGDLMLDEENPSIGLLSSPGEIKIRLTARAQNHQTAQSLASKIRKENGIDVVLISLGFPEKRDKDYFLTAHNIAKGDAFENTFSWQMGGDMPLMQQRGAVIALNTLRLGLLKGYPLEN